jgi:hypothetical protein
MEEETFEDIEELDEDSELLEAEREELGKKILGKIVIEED